jgi:hypothetical protein
MILLDAAITLHWYEVVAIGAVFGSGYLWGKRHGAAGKNALDTAIKAMEVENKRSDETHAAQIALLRDEIELGKGRAKDREADLQQKIGELTAEIASNASKEALTVKVKEVQNAATELSTANAAIGSSLIANAVVVPGSPSVTAPSYSTKPQGG